MIVPDRATFETLYAGQALQAFREFDYRYYCRRGDEGGVFVASGGSDSAHPLRSLALSALCFSSVVIPKY
jgi:hypothetical protein